MGLKAAGCQGGEGGDVFVAVSEGKGGGGRTPDPGAVLMQSRALWDSFLVSGVRLPLVMCSFEKGVVRFMENFPDGITVISNPSVVPRFIHLSVTPLRSPSQNGPSCK